MESPLNSYRAYVLSEIYKLGDDFAHVMASLKNSLTSKQVNALSKRSLELMDRIENLNRILWGLEIYIKSDLFNRENCQEIICIFNELREKQEISDINLRLKSRKIVELVLELVESQKQISPDEIVGLV